MVFHNYDMSRVSRISKKGVQRGRCNGDLWILSREHGAQAREGISLAPPEDALKKSGAERIFTDAGVSGAKANRPELDVMLDHLREGDTVIVVNLDRLGRSLSHFIALVEWFREMGVVFIVILRGSTVACRARAYARRLRRAGGVQTRHDRGAHIRRARGGMNGGMSRKYDRALAGRDRRHHASDGLTAKECARRSTTFYRLIHMAEETRTVVVHRPRSSLAARQRSVGQWLFKAR